MVPPMASLARHNDARTCDHHTSPRFRALHLKIPDELGMSAVAMARCIGRPVRFKPWRCPENLRGERRARPTIRGSTRGERNDDQFTTERETGARFPRPACLNSRLRLAAPKSKQSWKLHCRSTVSPCPDTRKWR